MLLGQIPESVVTMAPPTEWKRDVSAVNTITNARFALIHIGVTIQDCTFMNGISDVDGRHVVPCHDLEDDAPKYTTSEGNSGRSRTTNVGEVNLVGPRNA